MKFIAQGILFLFLAFLSTPTIVTLIEKNTDVSVFYNFAEEENQKEIKEIKEFKADLSFGLDYLFVGEQPTTDSKIIFINELRHDNIADEIFIPPPEQV